MLNEKRTEDGGWKDRLDRFDDVPGEPWTNKNASWDKLHARLHKKQGRKKTPWWWLAAAAVLLLFVSGTLLLMKHAAPKDLAKNKPTHAAPARPAPPESLLVIKNNPARPAGHTIISRLHRQPKTPSLPGGIPADTAATPQISIIPVITDTPLLNQVAMQPKKKLQVVHINELDNPGQEGTQWTSSPSYSPKRFFRLLLINTETSSSAASQKQDAGNNRFTIKTPIKN